MEIIDSLPKLLNAVTLDLAHVMIIGLCVAIFSYQVRTLERSRVFRNLKYCWIVMGIAYGVRILFAGADYLISVQMAGTDGGDARAGLAMLFDRIDNILSFTSTYFLIRAGSLLHSYPIVQLTKDFSAYIQLALATAVGISIVAMLDLHSPLLVALRTFLRYADVLCAGMAAVYVGRGFWKFGWRASRTLHTKFESAFRLMALFCFLIWGFMQLPYAFVDIIPYGHYMITLMVLKFSCAMSAVLFGVLFFDDRRDFRYPTGTSRSEAELRVSVKGGKA